jgi:hypothetical protein
MHRNMNVLRLGKISRAARRGRDDATAEQSKVSRWGKVWIGSVGKPRKWLKDGLRGK